jgi:hypothetical protein
MPRWREPPSRPDDVAPRSRPGHRRTHARRSGHDRRRHHWTAARSPPATCSWR